MKKLSPKTLEMVQDYADLWPAVFDAVYTDLADPADPSYDVEALELAGHLVPRPQIWPTK